VCACPHISFSDTIREGDIPPEYRQQAAELRRELIERCSNGDEQLCEMYMVERTPNADELRDAIRRACIRKQFVPVLCGSALKNKGVQAMLDAVIDYLPAPDEQINYAYVNNERILLDPTRSDAQPFVGMAFKLEVRGHVSHAYVRVCVCSATSLVS
jgi:elongation factor G